MITIAEYLYWRDRRSRGVYFELQAWLWREEYSAARARVLERLKFSAWQRIMQERPMPGRGGLRLLSHTPVGVAIFDEAGI